MSSYKRKVQFHYKPPQKVRMRRHELQRGMIVGIALLFIVFVFSFGNFFLTSLVGLATYTSPEGYNFSMDINNKIINVTINPLSKQVTSVYLEMTTTTTSLDLCKVLGDVQTSITNKLWKGDFYVVSCADNKLIFSDASLSDPQKSLFSIFQFSVKDFPSNFELVINPLDVYELEKGNDLFENKDYKNSFNVTGISPQDSGSQPASSPNVTDISPQDSGGQPASSPSSSGGGTYCNSEWECTSWSYCNNQLKQERICSDIKACLKNKVETRACAKCDESWQCSKWSDCSYNQQTRTCSDEHKCGSVGKKPVEKKSCTEIVQEQPQQEYYQPPVQEYQAPQVQQPVAQPPSLFSKYFNEYKNYLIAVPFVLLFIVILVIAVLHFTQRKGGVTHNYNELQDWIKKERAAGSNDEEIKQILAQNTGWSKDEVRKMLSETGK